LTREYKLKLSSIDSEQIFDTVRRNSQYRKNSH